MPVDKKKYPPEWDAFSADIRFNLAEGRCECMGECGLHKTTPGPRRCIEKHGTKAMWAAGRIILTVAHLCDCDPLCVNPGHVKAMCQRCHNRLDNPMRMKHAKETRRRRLAVGDLFNR